jgi:hypothetical protein
MGFSVLRRPSALRHIIVAGALSLSPVLQSAVAHAAPSAADRESARALLKEGDTKTESNDLSGALKAYQAAHEIMGLPSTGFAVARTQAALGLLVEARDSALLVTHIPARSGESGPIVKARADARKLADDLANRIGSIQVTLSGPPPGTDVAVTFDGEAVPTTSLELPRKANPGKHVLQASAPGFNDAREELSLAEGQSATVTLTLTPGAGAEQGSAGASAAATSSPFAPVQTDEQKAPTHKHLSPLVWAGFGVGAAGLITGTVTGVLHLTKISSIKDRYCGGGTSCDPGYQEQVDNARTTATIADIAFGVGIAGVAVGVVGLFLSPSSSDGDHATARVKTGPWCEPTIGVASLGMHGGF